MNNYFLYLDDTIHGPLSSEMIESMLREGTIFPDTPAASEYSPEWTTAGLLFNFEGLPTAPPRPGGVKSGGPMQSAANQLGLPAPKAKQRSVLAAATAALLVAMVLMAFYLFFQTKRTTSIVLSTGEATPSIGLAPLPPAQSIRERAEAGDAEAQYQLVRADPHNWDFSATYNNTKETQETFNWIRKAAEQGHAQAQYHLANCYQYGKGVPADAAESVKWYQKAAAQGVDAACLHLGVHYKNGWGVPKDASEAAKWYRQGSKSDVYALLALGRLYFEGGDGFPRDLVQALICFDLTLARGVADCFKANVQKDRDICAKEMTSEQIAEAKRLASEWKP